MTAQWSTDDMLSYVQKSVLSSPRGCISRNRDAGWQDGRDRGAPAFEDWGGETESMSDVTPCSSPSHHAGTHLPQDLELYTARASQGRCCHVVIIIILVINQVENTNTAFNSVTHEGKPDFRTHRLNARQWV